MSRKQRAAAKALYVESSVMANPHVKQVKPDLPKRKIKGTYDYAMVYQVTLLA